MQINSGKHRFAFDILFFDRTPTGNLREYKKGELA
jgi:hypothetical protein